MHDLVYAWIQDHRAPTSAPSPALGGDAYWLANGGKWYVHGMGFQLEQGPDAPPGYVGTETWNAYGAVVTGTVHLAFTPQPDGSLLGTYVDDPVYTKTGDASGWLGPDPSAPKKGQVIKLVPIAPMHAKIVGSSSQDNGNTNICQQGLPNATYYCGA